MQMQQIEQIQMQPLERIEQISPSSKLQPVMQQVQKKGSDLVTLRDIEAYVEFSKRDQAMSDEERGQLANLISQLVPEKQLGIVTIVREGREIDANEQHFTFDL